MNLYAFKTSQKFGMLVLGIESSCDDCSLALVRSGTEIIAEVSMSQVQAHAEFAGVVPELAARKHIEAIVPIYKALLRTAAAKGITASDIAGIGVTNRPGLSGSLAVGLNFAKGLALALRSPFIAIDHILAHIYAAQMTETIEYPHLALLLSGGHSLIMLVEDFNSARILGASIDDACGEAFDKLAKHLGLGYPGGHKIDQLAKDGNPRAYNFPFANLDKHGTTRGQTSRAYDLSYSGLKNAVINQRDKFWDGKSEHSPQNIAASFQRVAIDSVLEKLDRAAKAFGISRVVAGGGVVANSYLRSALAARSQYSVTLPPLSLCTDNASMIAGLAYHYLERGITSEYNEGVISRIAEYRHHTVRA